MSYKELPRTSGDQYTGTKTKTKWYEHEYNQVPVPFSVLLSLHTFYTYKYTSIPFSVIWPELWIGERLYSMITTKYSLVLPNKDLN